MHLVIDWTWVEHAVWLLALIALVLWLLAWLIGRLR